MITHLQTNNNDRCCLQYRQGLILPTDIYILQSKRSLEARNDLQKDWVCWLIIFALCKDVNEDAVLQVQWYSKPSSLQCGMAGFHQISSCYPLAKDCKDNTTLNIVPVLAVIIQGTSFWGKIEKKSYTQSISIGNKWIIFGVPLQSLLPKLCPVVNSNEYTEEGTL